MDNSGWHFASMRLSFSSRVVFTRILLCVIALHWPVGLRAEGPFHRPPAGIRPTRLGLPTGEGAIVPDGKMLHPLGAQIVVPAHPFGLALSATGDVLVASSAGAGPSTLTLVQRPSSPTPAVSCCSQNQDQRLASLFHGVVVGLDGRSLFASGGDDGRVHALRLPDLKYLDGISIDGSGFKDSLSSQLALSRDGSTLAVVDQANWRLVLIDTAKRRVLTSVQTGRSPFAVAFAPDRNLVFVANMGQFEYRSVETPPGTDPRGLTFPPFGYPSREARDGTVVEGRRVPGLGPANSIGACSVWGFDLTDRTRPQGLFMTRTGQAVSLPVEEDDEDTERPGCIEGGSLPCALAVSTSHVYVSNLNNDTVQELDRRTGAITRSIELAALLPGDLRGLRGLRPCGLALTPDHRRLFVALQGFNAVAVVDTELAKPLGFVPTGWRPSQVLVSPDGRRLFVANTKGRGSGPNGGRRFKPGPEGTEVGPLTKGSLSLIDIPSDQDLPGLTERVLVDNGVNQVKKPTQALPPIKYLVFIVKENRTFDEVLGARPGVRGDPSLARLGTPTMAPDFATKSPVLVMPNHVRLAERFAISDNFYCDADYSSDGHRWLVGVPPNDWVESLVCASLTQKTESTAPGRRVLFGSCSSLTPEEYIEAGSLWHHLARRGVTFRNWGEGFEFAGIHEDPGLKPTGGRLPLNIPMPRALFKRTSRTYPVFNMNIPDQYRADMFLQEFRDRYASGRDPLPSFIYVHLPNDHGAKPRPRDGYPSRFSFMADNDLALGRIISYLSRSRFWQHMAILVTEDDAQGGVDSIDAHRSLLLVASPWVNRGYISREHADFPSIHRAIFELLGLPPLSLADALAWNLGDMWTSTPDYSPYVEVPVDPVLFDPERAKDPLDPDYRDARQRPTIRLDDPEEITKLRRDQGLE